jgi:alanine racemase
VDLDAITANVRALIDVTGVPSACSVVKADGYGHGAVPAARAALRGGATWLAVALVEEAVELRAAGLDGPVLLLSEPPPGAEHAVVAHRVVPTLYSAGSIDRMARAAAAAGSGPVDVHLKVDTGMHRVGAQPEELPALARRVVEDGTLRLGGTCTHFAIADAPDDPYTAGQLARFRSAIAGLRAAGIDPGIRHASNSAGALFHPAARLDMVRLGIAQYGSTPDPGVDPRAVGVRLRPALSLVSEVSHVKVLPAGERLSYGLRYGLARRSVVATVPIGYADGISRRWSAVGGEVLIGGRRRPVAGRVTMDQLLVDCGPADDPASTVDRGDEVVLIGSQGGESITAWEWAGKLDTIAYEITCALTSRVPREYTGG